MEKKIPNRFLVTLVALLLVLVAGVQLEKIVGYLLLPTIHNNIRDSAITGIQFNAKTCCFEIRIRDDLGKGVVVVFDEELIEIIGVQEHFSKDLKQIGTGEPLGLGLRSLGRLGALQNTRSDFLRKFQDLIHHDSSIRTKINEYVEEIGQK
jgi:hypothetical protein